MDSVFSNTLQGVPGIPIINYASLNESQVKAIRNFEKDFNNSTQEDIYLLAYTRNHGL